MLSTFLLPTQHSTASTKSAGFSLLELLVVISIIGILIAIATAAFSTAQQKSRDARRRGDVKAMQNGFEQYFAQNNGAYAASCNTMVSVNGATIFPGGLPTDPKTSLAYSCTAATTSYCVCATLETGGGNATAADCATMGAISTTNSYYCAQNLQ